MSQSVDRVGIDISALSILAPFVIVCDDSNRVVAVSDAVAKRIEGAVGKLVDELISIRDDRIKDVRSMLESNARNKVSIEIASDPALPLFGWCFSLDSGYLMAAYPRVENEEELKLFSLQDFPEGNFQIELFVLREEVHQSMIEVKEISEELKKKNELLEESRVQLEKKIKEVETKKSMLAAALKDMNKARRKLQRLNTSLKEEIEERKRTEKELEEERKRFEDIARSSGDWIWEIDASGHYIYTSGNVEKILGYKPEELIGRTPFELMDRDDAEKTKRIFAELAEKREKIEDLENWNRAKDGRRVLLISNGVPVLDEDGGLKGYRGVDKDITVKKELENQLAQGQKLESIGRLAAGIAHEINTPTQYVGDNTRFLKDAFEDLVGLLRKYEEMEEKVREGVGDGVLEEVDGVKEEVDLEYLVEEIPRAIEQSLDGVERVTKIVRSMKEFSHPGGGGREKVDLNRAIESTVTVARNEWKYVAEMELDLEEGLPLVPCYVGEFNQVILNLVINAAHAIGEVVGDGDGGKGKIEVSTRRDGEWVEVRVKDTGGGIPEEIRERVFDPFFTTKGVGKGTGQGLAIARSVVVDKHGGEIDFESEVGKGTTFIIRLPLNVEDEGGAGEEVEEAKG